LFLGVKKYRKMALQVGGFSKIETINYAHESREMAMPSKN
jgi:hypothetical protein